MFASLSRLNRECRGLKMHDVNQSHSDNCTKSLIIIPFLMTFANNKCQKWLWMSKYSNNCNLVVRLQLLKVLPEMKHTRLGPVINHEWWILLATIYRLSWLIISSFCSSSHFLTTLLSSSSTLSLFLSDLGMTAASRCERGSSEAPCFKGLVYVLQSELWELEIR